MKVSIYSLVREEATYLRIVQAAVADAAYIPKASTRYVVMAIYDDVSKRAILTKPFLDLESLQMW